MRLSRIEKSKKEDDMENRDKYIKNRNIVLINKYNSKVIKDKHNKYANCRSNSNLEGFKYVNSNSITKISTETVNNNKIKTKQINNFKINKNDKVQSIEKENLKVNTKINKNDNTENKTNGTKNTTKEPTKETFTSQDNNNLLNYFRKNIKNINNTKSTTADVISINTNNSNYTDEIRIKKSRSQSINSGQRRKQKISGNKNKNLKKNYNSNFIIEKEISKFKTSNNNTACTNSNELINENNNKSVESTNDKDEDVEIIEIQDKQETKDKKISNHNLNYIEDENLKNVISEKLDKIISSFHLEIENIKNSNKLSNYNFNNDTILNLKHELYFNKECEKNNENVRKNSDTHDTPKKNIKEKKNEKDLDKNSCKKQAKSTTTKSNNTNNKNERPKNTKQTNENCNTKSRSNKSQNDCNCYICTSGELSEKALGDQIFHILFDIYYCHINNENIEEIILKYKQIVRGFCSIEYKKEIVFFVKLFYHKVSKALEVSVNFI